MTAPPRKPDRAAREAAALRQNLLRRKDQARQRQQANQADCRTPEPDGSAQTAQTGSEPCPPVAANADGKRQADR